MKNKSLFAFITVFVLLTSGSLPLRIYEVKAETKSLINSNEITVNGIIDSNLNNSAQFMMTSSYPEQNATKVAVDGFVIFQFSDNIRIDPSQATVVGGTLINYIYNEEIFDNNLVLYYNNLKYNTKYTINLSGAGIKDSNGNLLSEDFTLSFTTGVEFERLYGSNRFKTSVAISKDGFTKSDYVVLATGEDFPDALCAAPLAAKYGAPILLTSKDSLSIEVDNEISRLEAKEVFIVGGTGVISDNIRISLQNKGIKVTRISGVNRYETSLEVAKYIENPSKEVFIATGENYPDALSIAAYAGSNQIPILLTNKNKLSSNISNFIKNEMITKSYVIGGTGVISNNVLNSLPSPERIGGSNRYETNYNILARFPFFYGETYFATGLKFADALAGAALAAVLNNPIILVDDSMPNYIVEAIKENRDMIVMKKILGGTGAVSDNIIKRIFN